MLEFIDVALLPAEAQRMKVDAFIVVDVLRATTTIAALFDAGAAQVKAFSDIDQARGQARYTEALLFGEVRGLPPKGFDYGNSPVEAAAAPVRGRKVVLFTTNGTRALCELPPGDRYVGAIVNADAVAAAVAGSHARVGVVCAGTDEGSRFTLEDLAGAGVIVDRLLRHAPEAQLGDAAMLARETVARWPRGTAGMVRAAAHAHSTAALGFEADIDFACMADTSAAVPRVTRRSSGWAEMQDAAAE